MKIHYISCHQVLEQEEVTLLTEAGHQVFSNGAYLNPAGHPGLARPGIRGGFYDQHFEHLARTTPRTELPEELIKPFDVIIIMHTPTVLDTNWRRIKHKKVIWRSIGQSTPGIERMIKPMKNEGLTVVRYSPKEALIPGFAGEDAVIRFYKDPDEYRDWNGNTKTAINFSQSLKGRRDFCHYDEITKLINLFGGKVYGSGNEDLGFLNGGELPYEQFKQTLRDARVFVYGGTWPAPYTLSLIEAMMTGTPIVAIGKKLAEEPAGVAPNNRFEFYEAQEIIEQGVTGFYSDDLKELEKYISKLMSSYDLAKTISQNARASAINLFGKDKIKAEWQKLLNNL